ncbi:MAG: hypothetical protein HC853_02750 [Anaerolineae bacterium]|nr:hypothetical protein [Anaerolineae bacterium]
MKKMPDDVSARELPLFPLNVVLFPNENLPLHIFEMRYRIMIQRCIENKEPFGVVLALSENHLAPVGTAALVTDVDRLPDGRMKINTVGTERFRIKDWVVGNDGYLIGTIVDYPFDLEMPPTQELTQRVVRRMKRYLQLLAETNDMSFQVDRFPEDPCQLAVSTAIALQLDLEEKQELLEQTRVADLLKYEDDILAEEIKLLWVMSKVIQPPQDEFIFSRN